MGSRYLWQDGGYELGPNVLTDGIFGKSSAEAISHYFGDSWDTHGATIVIIDDFTSQVRTGQYSCHFSDLSGAQRFIGHCEAITERYVYYCGGFYIDSIDGTPSDNDIVVIAKIAMRDDGNGSDRSRGVCMKIDTTPSPDKIFPNASTFNSDGSHSSDMGTGSSAVSLDGWHWFVLGIDRNASNNVFKIWIDKATGAAPDITATPGTGAYEEPEGMIRQNVLVDGKGSSAFTLHLDDYCIYESDSFTDNPPSSIGVKKVAACADSEMEWSGDYTDPGAPSGAAGEKAYFAWADIASGSVEGLRMHFEGEESTPTTWKHTPKGKVTGSTYYDIAQASNVPKAGLYDVDRCDVPWYAIQAAETPEATPAAWSTTKLNDFIGGLLSIANTKSENLIVMTAIGTSLADPACPVSAIRRAWAQVVS